MKKIISLLILAFLCVSADVGFAQVRHNFQNSETYVDVVVDSATLQSLSHDFSVDRVQRNAEGTFNTRICLSFKDYDNFLAREIPYSVVQPTRASVTMATNYADMTSSWDRYPTYSTYLAMMDTFQTRYPNLCKIDTILASTPGSEPSSTPPRSHSILCAHISNNLNDNMGKPSVFYTSTMHGDEVVGYYYMLRLIDMLLSKYNTDTQITNLVNNVDIWICPLHNPDGTYKTSDNQINTSPTSTRNNGNGYDLNRNFPFLPNVTGQVYPSQPEMSAMMAFLGAHNFTLAANFHGGAEVFNYPWDAWTTSQRTLADADWWQYVGRKYVDTCRLVSSNYMTDTYSNGITEGGDWYEISGSMQDYHNWFLGTRHVTIEVSTQKVLSSNSLPSYWNYSYRSLLNLIEEANNGIHGTVTDSLTGEPLQAMVYVNNHDVDHSYVETTLPYGDYHRPIKAGQYSVTYSADGYFSKTITVNVSDGAKLTKNVQLVSTDTTSCRKPKNVTVNYLGGNSAEVSWNSMAQSNNIMLNNTLITDVTSPYTLTNLAFSTQYDVQVQANCGENGLSEWSESVSFTTPVACPVPTNLSCPAVTATTATLNWTENGEATDWVLQYGTNSNFTSGTYTQVEVNDNATEILTGLNTETDYYARVKADCGDVFGQSDWSATCTFKPTSIQMVEIGSGTATINYLPLNGSRRYSLSEQIYTTAELGEAGNIVSIGFYKNSTTSCNRNLDIYLVSTDKSSFSGNSDWITVTNADKVFTGTVNFANNDWTTITLTTPFAYDGTHNVAVIVDDNTGSSGYYSIPFLTYTGSPSQSIYYYNSNSYGGSGSSTNPDPTGSLSSASGVTASKNQIHVTFDRPDPVVCPAPTGVMVSEVDRHSAIVSWTENGTAVFWVVANKQSSDSTFTEEETSEPSYALTGLADGTDYTVKVRPVCESGEDNWSEEVSFTTESCFTISLAEGAWTENFDSVTTSTVAQTGAEPECWEVVDSYVTLTESTKPQVYRGYSTSGNYSLRLKNRCLYAMPALDESVDIGKLKMTFQLRQPQSFYRLQVGMVNENGDFDMMEEINNPGTGMTEVVVDFTGYSGNGRRIAFKNILRNSANYDYSYNYIDDITLEYKTVSCVISELPYTENFDGYTSETAAETGVEPDCWEVVDSSYVMLTESTRPQIYRGYATSGSYTLRMKNRCVYAMPPLDESIDISRLKMTFQLRQPQSFYRLQVGMVDTMGDFELVEEINNPGTGMTEVVVDFTGYSGNGRRIAFKNILRNSANYAYSYNYIDDINLFQSSTKIAEVASGNPFDDNAFDSDRYLDNITVYPNPTTGNLYIDAVDVRKVEVFNQMGQLVGVYGSEQTIDMGRLAQGVYMIHITVPQGVAVRKVMKR